jgi:hypothetical protein
LKDLRLWEVLQQPLEFVRLAEVMLEQLHSFGGGNLALQHGDSPEAGGAA